jgi:hypothetical protein
MSSTSEDINPTAITNTLPIMPSIGSGESGKSTNLEEFMKILLQSNACSREYCEMTKTLTLVFYKKTHTGCKVIIYLTGPRITITVFQHLNILENDNYTFNPTDFRKYVMPFLTPAELEQQKRFDDFQVKEQRLMAEQRKSREQEEKSRKEALEKAHTAKPKTCGGVNTCTICKYNEQHLSVCMWTSRFPPITGT